MLTLLLTMHAIACCISTGSRDWRRAPEDLRLDNIIVLEGGTACKPSLSCLLTLLCMHVVASCCICRLA
jgi:hypothetical protein